MILCHHTATAVILIKQCLAMDFAPVKPELSLDANPNEQPKRTCAL
jgi:hypothetical protein